MDFKDKQLIIFDLDGTLIDSIPDLTIALNKMLEHYGFRTLTIDIVTSFVGNGSKLLIERSLAYVNSNQNVTEDFIQEALKVYFAAYAKEVCNKTYLYRNVYDTLKYLDTKGYKMAVCTNKPLEFIEPILETLSIKRFFNYWIGENGVLKRKPDAEPILYVCKKMNVDPEYCIMVGDSKNDILGAQNAGMHSIGLTYGYNYNEDIATFEPTVVVNDFGELQKIF